jgi:hypothetical protein
MTAIKPDSEPAEGGLGPPDRPVARATDTPGRSLGYRTIHSVQRALIKPPALKLLLLNIAIHVNSDTGVAYPGLGRLAKECSLSVSHTKRLLRLAKEAGIISVVSQGGGRTSNRYQFDLDALAKYVSETDSPIKEEVVARLRGSMAEPGLSMNPVQGGAGSQSTRELAAGSPMSTKPQRPQRPQSLGEGGRTTLSGSASPPPWVVPELPVQLDLQIFTDLVETGPRTQPRVDALARKAFELVSAGHDANALAVQAIEKGWRTFSKPQIKLTKKDLPHQQSSPVTEARKQQGGRHLSAKGMARNLGEGTEWGMPK